uniref:Uncharacterized protein n=1 Tax=Cucumis melo TaxID=3656 RepID=A0A9I9CK88_CUCME
MWHYSSSSSFEPYPHKGNPSRHRCVSSHRYPICPSIIARSTESTASLSVALSSAFRLTRRRPLWNSSRATQAAASVCRLSSSSVRRRPYFCFVSSVVNHRSRSSFALLRQSIVSHRSWLSSTTLFCRTVTVDEPSAAIIIERQTKPSTRPTRPSPEPSSVAFPKCRPTR